MWHFYHQITDRLGHPDWVIPALVLMLITAVLVVGYVMAQYQSSPWRSMRNWKVSGPRIGAKYVALWLSIVFTLTASLRPQWGIDQQVSESASIDILFALDISKSMNALDFSTDDQLLDRLTVAKMMVRDFVKQRPHDRFGLVVFAGEAFVSSPLTFDLDMFLTFLLSVRFSDVSKGGTNLAEAINTSLARFSGPTEGARGQAVVLISDGEETVDSKLSQALTQAQKLQIPLYTIGIGSTQGMPIPERLDAFGKIIYKKHKGQTVYTRLNEKTLQHIAATTGGSYFHAENRQDMPRFLEHLESLPKTILLQEGKTRHQQHYQAFLMIGLLSFLVFLFLRPGKQTTEKNSRGSEKILLLLIAVLLSGCTPNEILTKQANNQANDALQQGRYEAAATLYKEGLGQFSALDPIIENNQAIGRYRLAQYEQVQKVWETLVAEHCEGEDVKEYCADFHYNLGNTLFRLGQKLRQREARDDLWKQALAAYEQTLLLRPVDTQAQENIAYIEDLMNRPPAPGEGLDGDQSEDSESGETSDENSQGESQQNTSGTQESEDSDTSENASSSQNQDQEQDQSENPSDQTQNDSQEPQDSSSQSDQQDQENSASQDPSSGEGEEPSTDNSSQQDPEPSQDSPSENTSDPSSQDQDNSEQEQGQSSSSSPLPQEVQDYLEQMQRQEQALQQHFNRTGQNQQRTYGDILFDQILGEFSDDPFFREFFGIRSRGTFQDPEEEVVEKDW